MWKVEVVKQTLCFSITISYLPKILYPTEKSINAADWLFCFVYSEYSKPSSGFVFWHSYAFLMNIRWVHKKTDSMMHLVIMSPDRTSERHQRSVLSHVPDIVKSDMWEGEEQWNSLQNHSINQSNGRNADRVISDQCATFANDARQRDWSRLRRLFTTGSIWHRRT